MLQRIKKISKGDFVRNSSLVFIVNNVNNVFNYVLIVIAIFYLKNDFGLWTSTTGFLAILSVPTSSFMSILTRKVSELAKTEPDKVYSYYINVFRFVRHSLVWVILGSIIIIFAMFWTLQLSNFFIPIVAILAVFTTFLYSINQNFLLGILEIPKYCWGNIINLVVKFISTTAFLILGLGVNTLPVGILLASIASYSLSLYFINSIYKTKEIKSKVQEFNAKEILQDGSDTWKAMIYFIILAIFLNIDIVLSRSLLTNEQNNQYGIISTFGQIAHFGPVSFSALVVPYASRDGHKNIFKISIIAVIILSLLVTVLFTFGGELVLKTFGKSNYLTLLPLITIYSIFVLCYNLIFISINYLISRANFTFIKPIVLAIICYLILLFLAGSNPWSTKEQQLDLMVYAGVLCSSVTSIFLVTRIFKLNSS